MNQDKKELTKVMNDVIDKHGGDLVNMDFALLVNAVYDFISPKLKNANRLYNSAVAIKDYINGISDDPISTQTIQDLVDALANYDGSAF